MFETIPLSVPSLQGNEWKYIKECLDSNWVSYVGPLVEKFEKKLAEQVQAGYAVATNSGAAALHISLLLANVGINEEVVMPGITFVAPANAVRYCGAWPAFIDVCENDWQMDIGKLSDFLSKHCYEKNGQMFNRTTNRRIAALLPVHLLGGMGDVDATAELAEKYDLPLIEDAAECIGATYKGRAIGAPLDSAKPRVRFVVTSFNGNKIVTTGGGGAIFTDDEDMASRARHLCTTAKKEGVEYFHDRVGYNYRMTNISAALGLAQLEKLEEYVTIKRYIAATYNKAFASKEYITTHKEPENCNNTYWMYTIYLNRNSRTIIANLNEAGIAARPIWVPIYNLPVFKGNCFEYQCEFAGKFYERALSIPCSVGLREEQCGRVISTLLDILEKQN